MLKAATILGAAALAIAAVPANADILVQTAPRIIVRPMVQRAIIPSVVRTQTFMQFDTPQVPVVRTESALITESTLGSASDFAHRLDMLRDQINLGRERGMINSAAADALMQRYQTLSADLQANGTATRDRYESFEQQINVLNQDVSNAMQ